MYIPKTRSDLGIPDPKDDPIDYEEYLGDTPIYTLFTLIRQQLLAFPAYLCEFDHRHFAHTRLKNRILVYNVSGQKNYPWWTSHFDRKSTLMSSMQEWKFTLYQPMLCCSRRANATQ